FPSERRHVIQQATSILGTEIGWKNIDAVAGGETAGIPYAAWIAEAADKPMLYVRKKPKGFGRNAQIEGDFADGARIVLIEDLATDGASKVNFVNALRTAGAKVNDAFVVFFYGIFPGALQGLASLDVRLHFLATWWDVLKVADEDGYFPKESIAEVRRFLNDPVSWSAAHGGKSKMGD
ncbi:MAG: orotate phosphoribosyltransferase, partial [Alphaproteobacteria bacterium]|nr:orotate phosphoribosyltransferase [Alphaproteobacteria bacterium]